MFEIKLRVQVPLTALSQKKETKTALLSHLLSGTKFAKKKEAEKMTLQIKLRVQKPLKTSQYMHLKA